MQVFGEWAQVEAVDLLNDGSGLALGIAGRRSYQVFGEWAQVEAVDLLNDGSGLAFGIAGGRSSGVRIKSVLPGGVADRDGRLRPGDMLLRIGDVSVVGMCGAQAAAVLRQCGARVPLLVARPADPSSQSLGASQAPIVPSRFLTDPEELQSRLAEAGHHGYAVPCDDVPPSGATIIDERHSMRPVASIVAVVPQGALATPQRPPSVVTNPSPIATPAIKLPLDMAVRGPKQPETLSYEVDLSKDSTLGLGITVAGYVCEQEELSGIFVKSISEGSAAFLSGQIQVNDRIVEVDGVNLHGVTNHRAVALLRDAKGPIVKLKALRYLRGAGFEKLQRALAAQDGRPIVAPPSPSVTSLAKYTFSVYEESTVIETEIESEAHHLPSPTSPSSEAEFVIGADDETTRGQVRRIQDKWRDLLDHDPDWPGYPEGYDIIVGTVVKEARVGIGISLEGTVRVVNGKEVQARHYIRALAPGGALEKLNVFQVGDELLEVSGWRVPGAQHVAVVARLRAPAQRMRIVCARARPRPPERLAERKSSVGSIKDLLSPPPRLIKAKSESSMNSACSASTIVSGIGHDEFCPEALERNRSRSLEVLSGLAMWSERVEYVDLVKQDRGLGFSILDYLSPYGGGTVIVIRSIVAGGAASLAGAPRPGDRLLYVNGQDVASATLAQAVTAIKQAPKGIVRIGIAKPISSAAIIGGEKGVNTGAGSQDCINSLASDDHTTLDSYHECLQEYGEGLEVVQICLEPEDYSLKDEVTSVLSLEEDQVKLDKDIPIEEIENNGEVLESAVSRETLLDQDDEVTITEDLRELPEVLKRPSSSSGRHTAVDELVKSVDSNFEETKTLEHQSKEISTSDEMVFAVTPTGLERISYDKYFKDCDTQKCSIDDLNMQNKDLIVNCCLKDKLQNLGNGLITAVQENTLLFIDHDMDGYETCLDDDSNSIKSEKIERIDRKISYETLIKGEPKNLQVTRKNCSNSAKSHCNSQLSNKNDEENTSTHRYVQEHIIKQMKSLRIEPLNIKIKTNKTKSLKENKHNKVKCVEYYNDQAECLEEYRRQKKIQEEEKQKLESKERYEANLALMEKKLKMQKQETSEESTDLENYIPGCHKCFLENYAFEIKQAYKEADNCKYCAVIKDMLETTKYMSDRRLSAPALVSVESMTSDTDESDLLALPSSGVRRTSAGPLRFCVPTRRASHTSPKMTVTVSPDRRSDVILAQRWGAPRRVSLTRELGQPLGVSIVGGKVDIVSSTDSEDGDEKAIFGIFIKNVVPDSPAGRCGELNTGDRILEVDGLCVRNASHDRVVQLIKSAGDTVSLTIQSLLAWNTDSSDVEVSPSVGRKDAPSEVGTPEHEIKITVTSEPDADAEPLPETPKPSYSDSESSDDEEDERDLGGRTYSEQGVEIDRASAGAIKRSREEKEADPEKEDEFGYTTNKIRKKYSALGDSIVSVKLERTIKAGLGISLAGHRDRSRMAVFVCGLNPAGAAAKAKPAVKIGDEILEVNGIVLHGRCHLNASVIIKGLAGPIFKFILLRRKQALEDVAVKPLTQFPMALEEDSDDRFSSYKGVKDVSIKKGTSSLGIMIIEGRHAEVGQGIFISDIQEGSPAEQAGLQIGDMVLAVNKDSLLGCSYDTAAATLKRTEGVVILTVCNPNKKDDSPTEDTASGAVPKQPSRPQSRNQTPDVSLKPGASRPVTPKPPVSPAKEPMADPATAVIQPNKETVVEITTNGKTLGLMILGGSDSAVNGPAAVILEVYPKGAAAIDGRLKQGDQIVECNGVPITKDMTYEKVCLAIKRVLPKIRMTVYRPDPIPFSEVVAELTRKPGKGLGLVLMAKTPPPGCYISDLLPGGAADLDGRLRKGDLLTSVDGKDVSSSDHETVAIACKTVGSKAVIKVKRFKIVR